MDLSRRVADIRHAVMGQSHTDTRDAVINLCDVVAHLVNRVEELESKHDVSSRRLDAADRAARKGG